MRRNVRSEDGLARDQPCAADVQVSTEQRVIISVSYLQIVRSLDRFFAIFGAVIDAPALRLVVDKVDDLVKENVREKVRDDRVRTFAEIYQT